MKSLRASIPTWFLVSLIIIIGTICILWLWNLGTTTGLGKNDFIGYWSAAYLLHNGQNAYNPDLMRMTQQIQIHTGWDYAIMAWNPPTLLVFLLPLAWLSFTSAKSAWLIINVIIILTTTMMLARLYFSPGKNRVLLLYLLFAISWPQVLVGITMGQVTSLVFLGIVACMMLIKKERWFWAGAALLLTSVKPHLVLLPGVYLLAYMAKKCQYKGWVGLVTAGSICVIILFILRPDWISDFFGMLTIISPDWGTPTIGSLFRYFQLSNVMKYMIILFLPLPFLFVRYREKINMEFSVALLILITVPTTIFGWSYDQTILLVPIAQVFSWLSRSKNKVINVWITTIILISLVLNYYQRIVTTTDLFYVWIPLLWWIIFGVSWYLLSETTHAES